MAGLMYPAFLLVTETESVKRFSDLTEELFFVGTLLEIGRGDRRPECVEDIFAGRIRAEAGFTVPARGLCLMEVQYP
jgi:hypothetical protein